MFMLQILETNFNDTYCYVVNAHTAQESKSIVHLKDLKCYHEVVFQSFSHNYCEFHYVSSISKTSYKIPELTICRCTLSV